mmetsp:Transcript_10606/g.24141  ORF Transcript_10606/g.24141 Transcript_10606/m.24141 type:complete len:222 (-) Transcript_10606:118-783(-)
MPAATIEITEGIQERTSRLGLKKAMMVFGEVEACHMGDRAVEVPIVRFRQQSSAEAALNALKTGQVFLDGFSLNGEWRGTRTPAMINTRRHRDEKPQIGARRDETEDLSSRMLMENRRSSPPRGGAGGGDRGGGRRSRSRGRRKRSRSRSPRMLMTPPLALPPVVAVTRSAPPLQSGAKAEPRGTSLVLAPLLLFEGIEVASSMGNLESTVSENPLFQKGK